MLVCRNEREAGQVCTWTQYSWYCCLVFLLALFFQSTLNWEIVLSCVVCFLTWMGACLFVLASDELEKHVEYFTNLVIRLLTSYKVLTVLEKYLLNMAQMLWINPFLSLSLSLCVFLYLMLLAARNFLHHVQETLGPSVGRISKFVENLKKLSEG